MPKTQQETNYYFLSMPCNFAPCCLVNSPKFPQKSLGCLKIIHCTRCGYANCALCCLGLPLSGLLPWQCAVSVLLSADLNTRPMSWVPRTSLMVSPLYMRTAPPVLTCLGRGLVTAHRSQRPHAERAQLGSGPDRLPTHSALGRARLLSLRALPLATIQSCTSDTGLFSSLA